MATTTDNINNILDDLTTIGINVFRDDITTLKTLVICYRYVEKKLKDENTEANLLEEFNRQEKLLGLRMYDQLKSLEDDCTTQLWLNEDYGDPLLFETRAKTEEIKRKIMYYRWRHVHRRNTNKQLVKYCEKLLRKMKNLGVECSVSESERIVINQLQIQI